MAALGYGSARLTVPATTIRRRPITRLTRPTTATVTATRTTTGRRSGCRSGSTDTSTESAGARATLWSLAPVDCEPRGRLAVRRARPALGRVGEDLVAGLGHRHGVLELGRQRA